ncbi:MarR family transcriptional regulator [Anaerocolumna sedimenticola]|uniref:MarR family transcriptional regulator n=1 Tax=Anaerocolumna sedimenticola TaxID=2696063 RepID=A0A6P1TL67_9FIRM|nr:MarR family transcriptional regulator [Anaerocolumna sedimenticola]QHQ61794.1 MarR family transcriptional regulator [Anaerocolumna sedimenticola]
MDSIDKKAYVFGSIFTLANRLQILGDKLDKNLTVKQWLLLAGLTKYTNEAPTLSEVAAQIGNSRQNIKKMALILEREGFLILKKDSQDARILRLELTCNCKEYLKKRENKEIKFIEELFTGFPADLLNGLYSGIEMLSNTVKEMEINYEFKEWEE